MDYRVTELCLLLLYLTSWDEDYRKYPGKRMTRSWKGYPRYILRELAENNLIIENAKASAAIITDIGKLRAEQIKQRYL